MKGLKIKTNKNNGYTVVYCHYSADPHKDEKWVEAEKKLYPNLNAWKRMYEIDFIGMEGTPVHPTFNNQKHVANLSYNPLKPILRGWDFGVDYCSCKFYQFDQWGRFLTLAEFVKHRPISFREFAVEALVLGDNLFPPVEDKNEHIIPIVWEDYGDHSGTWQSDNKGKVYVEVLADLGVYVITSAFSKTTKTRAIELINQRLNTEVVVSEKDGVKITTPQMLIDESCKVTIEAYSGGYVLDKKERPLSPNHPYEEAIDPDHYVLINKDFLIKQKKLEKSEPEQEYSPISGYVC